MLAETLEPVLVYRRIDSNRRATRLLLASLPFALLPAVAASTMLLSRITRADLPGALIISTLLIVVGVASFITCYGSEMVLWLSRARRLRSGEEPGLVRTVENLCIGMGLPVPGIHLIESQAPNAMATGSDPQHASLAVTRGLLTLLDDRELQAVLAHELSHIANHDTRLSTMLVPLVGIACFPITTCVSAFRFVWRTARLGYTILMVLCRALFVFAIMVIIGALNANASWLVWGVRDLLPPSISPLWSVMSVAAGPVYVLIVSPIIVLLIRQGVSRQREFLADADAVRLTRDPEGLALALVKVSAAQPIPLPGGEGCMHLYFVDPRGQAQSLLDAVFPSHPPVIDRIHLLARMGSVASSALRAALDAGESRHLQLANVDAGPHSQRRPL